MIKLTEREMNRLSRILSVLLCFAPFAYASAGPVATTSGSNLTAYNPSNANNNQWATMSNGRYDTNVSAKADFGNCNALILRCAQPKCNKGGCTDASVAAAIVRGCVQSNKSCAQYGDDLVEYMSAQLVASSTAKVNEQQLAAQQAAAAAAQQQSEQQMAQMQYQMQQMQEQMAQQQAESQQQLQAALAEQAAQNAAALESMKSAATEAAKENEAGISAYQQEAIDRGISADVLERQTVAGQIMTEIENAEVSLKEVKTAMNTAFEYAKCDARGNNCSGPKRVKKWRELASDFLTPYDNTIDKIYDALVVAQTVGIDLSQIYMMLNNSCNSWGQYMCPHMAGGYVQYPSTNQGQKGTPLVCPPQTDCLSACEKYAEKQFQQYNTCVNACFEQNTAKGKCQPCTLLKVLTDKDTDAVYEGWINADYSADNGNTTVVACASSALDSSALFSRRTKNKNGAGLVDIDKLDTWIHQVEPSKKYGAGPEPMAYCDVSTGKDKLEKSVLSKIVPTQGVPLCVKEIKTNPVEDKEECGYINPIYAICDTHPYNAGKALSSQGTRDDTDNCTADAQKDNGYINADKIIWAQKENNVCKVKFCNLEYKPEGDGKGCIADANFNENNRDYQDLKQKYQEHLAALYGDTREIIGLKTTVISQQMYKQYEYLNATLRRLKTQLEKATLTATLEAAGAKNEDGSSSSSGLIGGGNNDDKTIHLAGANNCSNFMDFDSAYNCLQNNAALIKSNVSTNTKKACLQLQETVSSADSILVVSKQLYEDKCAKYKTPGNSCKDNNKNNITACANALNMAVMNEKRSQSQQNKIGGK